MRTLLNLLNAKADINSRANKQIGTGKKSDAVEATQADIDALARL